MIIELIDTKIAELKNSIEQFDKHIFNQVQELVLLGERKDKLIRDLKELQEARNRLL